MPFSTQNFSSSFHVNSPPPSVLKTFICFPDCLSAYALNFLKCSNTSLLALMR
ncbi:unnamed protein product [Lupinus luteus]|uniref:Uncharacterized protein n=1 Tax=Lupinus luteus TaxID=3873 RepID=A0AAV1YI49_LUPLU